MRRRSFFWLVACLIAGWGTGGQAAQLIYWSLFNIEGESSLTADYVTYATLEDMLTDSNRTGVFSPNGFGVGKNVVGSGSDGTTFWNAFNIEGESSLTADYVTYATLEDMLGDSNRTGVFSPNGFGVGKNVVGSGTDGTTYWSLFNIEGESSLTADYVTYATLEDMLGDSNRTGVFSPNGFGVGKNVVGSGAFFLPDPAPIPAPASLPLLATALAGLGGWRARLVARHRD